MMQKVNFEITNASPSDAKQIAVIEAECFSAPWSERQLEEEILKDNVIFIVAKSGDVILGYISGQMILDEFYISNIAVKEPYRNNHIGRDILMKLISILKTKDCSFATLEVRESNSAARKLYEKCGFKNLGIRKDFYSSPKENACIYTLFFENEVIYP